MLFEPAFRRQVPGGRGPPPGAPYRPVPRLLGLCPNRRRLLKFLCPLHRSDIEKIAKFQQIKDTFYFLHETSWNSETISLKSAWQMTKMNKKCKFLRRSLEISSTFWWKFLNFWAWSGAKAQKYCRSRQELSNEYLLAKIGVDTAENKRLHVGTKISEVSRMGHSRG